MLTVLRGLESRGRPGNQGWTSGNNKSGVEVTEEVPVSRPYLNLFTEAGVTCYDHGAIPGTVVRRNLYVSAKELDSR